SAPGADLRYEEEKVESSWNFINKLWNITRFITMNIDDLNVTINEETLRMPEKWILTRLNQVIKEADYNYDKFEFGEASRSLYTFIWDEFAAWYVEFAKISLQNKEWRTNTQATLLYVLRAVLKMMHPFIPFVTEKLFLEISNEESIMISSWPKTELECTPAVLYFNEVIDTITQVRNLRSENNVAPSKALDIHLVIEDSTFYDKLIRQEVYFKKFLNADHLTIEKSFTGTEETILLVGRKVLTYVNKSGIIDPKKEMEGLLKNKSSLENEIERSKALLSNQSFIAKAPEAKLVAEKEKYQDYLKQYEKVLEKLKDYAK
ncbi:MAG: class I tRNA ligase family protein, partial [Acholeplasmataceae bacterium]|nr:class I tRNA ligase family protein [Acholeplasmataceae bacterium]